MKRTFELFLSIFCSDYLYLIFLSLRLPIGFLLFTIKSSQLLPVIAGNLFSCKTSLLISSAVYNFGFFFHNWNQLPIFNYNFLVFHYLSYSEFIILVKHWKHYIINLSNMQLIYFKIHQFQLYFRQYQFLQSKLHLDKTCLWFVLYFLILVMILNLN